MIKFLRKIKQRSIFLFLIIFLLYACQGKQHPPVSFYYWKQTYELNQEQKKILSEVNSKRLYIKFFDLILDENDQVIPTAKIEFKQATNLEVIPCVFIQNDVFLQSINMQTLSKKVYGLIHEIAQNNQIEFNELQIDCDWTQGTRDMYFQFLKEIQNHQAQLNLVCTIRLHQIKYASSSGIPPVKKGLLMCYNMDNIDDFSTPNSILSSKILKQYINENTSYPIELDLGLPIYQWGLIFRLGRLSVISNDLSIEDLKVPEIKKIKNTLYLAQKNVVINETSICKGDLIRLEESLPEELLRVANELKLTNLKFNQIIYYHISQDHLSLYHAHLLSQINSLIP